MIDDVPNWYQHNQFWKVRLNLGAKLVSEVSRPSNQISLASNFFDTYSGFQIGYFSAPGYGPHGPVLVMDGHFALVCLLREYHVGQ